MDNPDPDPILWQILLQVLLILLNAIFACAEIAVISTNEKKLEKLATKGDKRANRLLGLIKQPAKFLSVIQVCITLAGFLASAFAADNFSDRLTAVFVNIGVKIPVATLNTISVVLITLVLSYFTLVLGELVPKRIAMKYAEKVALAMSRILRAISVIFAPMVWLLSVSTNGILRLFGIDPAANANDVTEDEIRLMVDASTENGVIDVEEREFIHKLFEFDDIPVEEIMTHRANTALLWMEDDMDKWEQTIDEEAHTFYPVCDGDVDNVVGVLSTKEYFRLKSKDRENVVALIKPAYFVPETVHADVLFRNMKKTKNHFAVVVDEYGGMSGVVTINDLLEQLVGDLDDDVNSVEESTMVEAIGEGVWLVKGDAWLSTVAEKIGVALPDDEHDTFGGLVFALLGSIPSDDEVIEVQGFGLNIKLTQIKDRRLVQSEVRLAQQAAPAVQ